MYELILTMKGTPHGMRIGGPDPDRAIYLPVLNGQAKASKPPFGGEHVWKSPELDIVVLPTTGGVEVKIIIYATKSQPASAAVKAA
jgi:hypothetical protein